MKSKSHEQLSYWRSQQYWEKRWLKMNHKWTEVEKMIQGHATGWIAGVAWAKKDERIKRRGF